MHGLFVTIVITTSVILIISIYPECHPLLYITTENNYVTEPDAVLIYCPCHGLFVTIMVTTKKSHACILIDSLLGVFNGDNLMNI